MTNDNSDQPLVKASGIDKVFKRGSEVIHVLGGLNLDIPAGEFLALMGPSGSGKSTFLNLIGGLDRPTEGSIEVGFAQGEGFVMVTGRPGTGKTLLLETFLKEIDTSSVVAKRMLLSK